VEARGILNELLVELDDVRFGKIARAAVAELVRQTSHQRLAALAERLVQSAIENWDPPGPNLTDKVARKMAIKIACPAVGNMILTLLEDVEA